MKKYLYIAVLPFIMVSCMLPASYVGNSYASTDKVDMYYSEFDVKADYETMGHADQTCTNTDSGVSDAQKKIVELAKEKGADGIIFYKPDVIVVENEQRSVVKASFIKYKK